MDLPEIDPTKREYPRRKAGKYFIYLGLLGLGVVISIFARGGFDILKNGANIASQTADEILNSGSGSASLIETIPLKKSFAPNSFSPKTVPKSAAAPEIKKENIFIAIPSSTSQGLGAASSSPATSSALLAPAPPDQTSSSASVPAIVQVAEGPDHILIYEVQISGGPGKTEEDFIRIFNPTGASADISGWKLRKKTQSGGDSSIKVVPDGTALASGAVYMWANSKDDFAGKIGAQISSTAAVSSDNSIAILDKDGKVIDALAWGSGHTSPYIEGSAYPVNPDGGQSIKRKIADNLPQDTNNNSADFTI